RDATVTGVQTCALPISARALPSLGLGCLFGSECRSAPEIAHPCLGPSSCLKIGQVTLHVPLFPLNTVLFAGMTLPLKVFEERYHIGIASCRVIVCMLRA